MMDTLQDTARAATSKPVQRAVVNTVLLVSGGVTLLGLAAVASGLFFQNFVPDQVATTPVHLQYGAALNPYGVASLTHSHMKPQQDYDISVSLSMPRSPPNVERGNFMVSLYLLDREVTGELPAQARRFADDHADFGGSHAVVFESRRPALLPYADPIISIASRVLFLFYHMFVPSTQMVELTIPLAERVLFPKSAVVPSSAYVEVEAGQTIQIYSAKLIVTAQLRGLRWLMFHYRLPTYLTFTFVFWLCEVLFMFIAWLAWHVITDAMAADTDVKPRRVGSRPPGQIAGTGYSNDDDDDELGGDSDHPHTFPTSSSQRPLKYEPEAKSETEAERSLSDIPLAGGDADDEGDGENEDDDDEDYRRDDPAQRDFGIATSYSEEGVANVRRRMGAY